jgi:tetratricopeptide (TPR) repeat protein
MLQMLDKELEQKRRLEAAGVTEKAIRALAARVSADVEDLGQAWKELLNAFEIAIELQAKGQAGSNHGDFVDAVLARVAELAREGEYARAGDEIDAALAEQQAKTIRLYESGVEVALLAGNEARAADLLIAKAEAEGKAGFEELQGLFIAHYEHGRDKGLAQPLEVAIALARRIHARAQGSEERGVALNDLGVALRTLGERESDTARLEEAVTAYRAALEVRTRKRAPFAGPQR